MSITKVPTVSYDLGDKIINSISVYYYGSWLLLTKFQNVANC
jgi:hypothetical protein